MELKRLFVPANWALGMSRTQLSGCLRLLEQLEELPEAIGRRLTLSRHEALFKVPDVWTRSARCW